jgi:hypothetical protein
MTPEAKLRYVHSLVQVMRYINNNNQAEWKFCNELAEWLGYESEILERLIIRIFWEKADALHA